MDDRENKYSVQAQKIYDKFVYEYGLARRLAVQYPRICVVIILVETLSLILKMIF